MSSTTDNGTKEPKKGLFARFQDAKKRDIPDEDVKTYTGKTKDELKEWSRTASGVAGNRTAGGIDVGSTSGLGGLQVEAGYGGWGPDAARESKVPPEGSQLPTEKSEDKAVKESDYAKASRE